MSETELAAAITLLKKKDPDAILTGNAGFLIHRNEFNMPVYTDYSLNTFNDIDVNFLYQYNVIPIVSPELSLGEMEALQNKNVVIFTHGDIVLVNTKINPFTAKLIDEKGSVFNVRKENSYWQILNSRPFGLFNDIEKLRTAGFNRFYFDKEVEVPMPSTIPSHPGLWFSDRRIRKGYTSGHLYKSVL